MADLLELSWHVDAFGMANVPSLLEGTRGYIEKNIFFYLSQEGCGGAKGHR